MRLQKRVLKLSASESFKAKHLSVINIFLHNPQKQNQLASTLEYYIENPNTFLTVREAGQVLVRQLLLSYASVLIHAKTFCPHLLTACRVTV